MPDSLGEQLLASYPGLGEAMAVQTFLAAAGIDARVADLAQVPQHLFGMFGAMGRSAGLWVLDEDLERARELVAAFTDPENALDEQALAAEALAAPMPEPEADPAPSAEDLALPAAPQLAAEGRGRGPRASRGVPIAWRMAAIGAVLVLAVLLARACR